MSHERNHRLQAVREREDHDDIPRWSGYVGQFTNESPARASDPETGPETPAAGDPRPQPLFNSIPL